MVQGRSQRPLRVRRSHEVSRHAQHQLRLAYDPLLRTMPARPAPADAFAIELGVTELARPLRGQLAAVSSLAPGTPGSLEACR